MGETEPVRCPFCGAPYRNVIPAYTVQVKCAYCGSVFRLPPTLGTEVSRCCNHPEKIALGMCNDCERSFCGSCLHRYELQTRDTQATLYLCPDCLKTRIYKRFEGYIYVGALLLMIGIFASIIFLPWGGILLLFGLISLLYGFLGRPSTIDESTVDETRDQQEKRRAQLAEFGEADVESMYDKLVSQYVHRWGATEGIQNLTDELNAYMRHGQSYEEAVIALYRRQGESFQTNRR